MNDELKVEAPAPEQAAAPEPAAEPAAAPEREAQDGAAVTADEGPVDEAPVDDGPLDEGPSDEAGHAASAVAEPAPAPSVSDAELSALQAAEEAKGDPELDEVEPADIEVEGEKEESFEKLAAKAKKMSPQRARSVIEAILFLAERPLTPEELRAATGLDVGRVNKALDALSGHLREGVSGIVLHEVAGGWQLRSAPDAAEYARRFLKVKPQRLTRAALETLAIIAYRQPVTRPEIEELRGVDCGAVVKALLERKLIKILGKKEEPGRPMLYGTTKEFLEFFALKDLASLPTLREFHELSEEHRDIVEKEAPAEADAGPQLTGLVAELADPNLRAALESKHAEGEAALEELERAMEDADEKARAAQRTLEPPKEEPLPPLADAAPVPSGVDVPPAGDPPRAPDVPPAQEPPPTPDAPVPPAEEPPAPAESPVPPVEEPGAAPPAPASGAPPEEP